MQPLELLFLETNSQLSPVCTNAKDLRIFQLLNEIAKKKGYPDLKNKRDVIEIMEALDENPSPFLE